MELKYYYYLHTCELFKKKFQFKHDMNLMYLINSLLFNYEQRVRF